jgi:chorismate dehydratase
MPLEKIRTVALDSSSMTSVALTKVIFAKWMGGVRAYTAMPPKLDEMLRDHDAGLLIGDPALQVDRSRYRTYDLAEEWIRLTGKPFVFAFWAVRRAALQSAPADLDLAAVFQESRNHGLETGSLDAIAKHWGPQLHLSEMAVKTYLTENIYYYLDSACLQGLRLFYRYAKDVGALPKAPPLEFYELPKVVAK